MNFTTILPIKCPYGPTLFFHKRFSLSVVGIINNSLKQCQLHAISSEQSSEKNYKFLHCVVLKNRVRGILSPSEYANKYVHLIK